MGVIQSQGPGPDLRPGPVEDPAQCCLPHDVLRWLKLHALTIRCHFGCVAVVDHGRQNLYTSFNDNYAWGWKDAAVATQVDADMGTE